MPFKGDFLKTEIFWGFFYGWYPLYSILSQVENVCLRINQHGCSSTLLGGNCVSTIDYDHHILHNWYVLFLTFFQKVCWIHNVENRTGEAEEIENRPVKTHDSEKFTANLLSPKTFDSKPMIVERNEKEFKLVGISYGLHFRAHEPSFEIRVYNRWVCLRILFSSWEGK